MTSEQVTEWEAYNQIEPIGEYRRDYMMAQLTSIFYNFATSFGAKNGRRQVGKIADFIPWMDEQKPQTEVQSVDEMKGVLFSFAKASEAKENKQVKKEVPKYPKPPKRGKK